MPSGLQVLLASATSIVNGLHLLQNWMKLLFLPLDFNRHMKMYQRLFICEQKLVAVSSSTCFIVLLPEFKNALRIFPEIEMSVESSGPKKRKLNGKTDYTVGLGKDIDIFDNTPPRELHLVAIEAKNSSLDEDDLWQCVAETATLYKSRKDAGKAKCAVWGVLSNANHWKFIHIDEDGKLWRSKEFLLELRSYNQDEVLFIYRLLHYVVKCCYESCTPNPTPASSSGELNE